MNRPRFLRLLSSTLAAALLLVGAEPAFAHWCNCLWASGYNLVVRPAQDTVTVPSTGSATLDVFVQNNMGYPLYDFRFYAKPPAGYAIQVSGPAPKVTSGKPYLMPGEKLKKTLTITNSSGGSLAVDGIDFYVDFGNGSFAQGGMYGNYYKGASKSKPAGSPAHNAVAIKKASGAVAPSGLPALGYAGDQAINLGSAAKVDFGGSAGLDELLDEYCLARGSFTTGTCTGSCVTPGGSPSKLDMEHLWAIAHLAARKSAMNATQVSKLRTSLQCGWKDPQPVFRYLAAFVLGYLGNDAASKTFLTNIATAASGDADDKLVAKASLLAMGDATYRADVVSGAASGNELPQDVCAAALGIVDKNDQAVTNVLLARARWVCPASCDTTDNPKPFFASHLLEIVSWDRRGFATQGNDTGYPSYYNSAVADTTPPRAPQNVACTASTGGTIQVTWTAVTLDTAGKAETGVTYKVYSDTAAHASCTNPGDSGCNYAHVDASTAFSKSFLSQAGTSTFYYRVTAVDAASNESAFSGEVSCKPEYAPVAKLTCTPSTGTAPPDLSVTCDASASTDANGNADITTYSFKLDAAAAQSGTAKTKAYTFSTPSNHTVQLTVTDSTGLTHAASAAVSVNPAPADAGTAHHPPVAKTTGTTPVSGVAPLTVRFDGSESSGDTALTYSWDFGDGSPANTTAKPTHTYSQAGDFTATLTVKDTLGATGTAIVTLTVTAPVNGPPDVSAASAAPLSGDAPLAVHFDSTRITDPEGDTIAVTWNFGDGSAVSHDRSVDHTYATAGSYHASLSAQDDGTPAAGPATRAFNINVTAAGQSPDCAGSKATVSPTRGEAPLAVHMDARGCTDPAGKDLTFEWRIPVSPEVVLTTAEADYTFTAAGTYTISLVATNNATPPLPAQRDFPIEVVGGPEPGPDAGDIVSPDSGAANPTSDGGGTNISSDGGSGPGPNDGVVVPMCGCSATTASPSGIGLLLAAMALRRRRRGNPR